MRGQSLLPYYFAALGLANCILQNSNIIDSSKDSAVSPTIVTSHRDFENEGYLDTDAIGVPTGSSVSIKNEFGHQNSLQSIYNGLHEKQLLNSRRRIPQTAQTEAANVGSKPENISWREHRARRPPSSNFGRESLLKEDIPGFVPRRRGTQSFENPNSDDEEFLPEFYKEGYKFISRPPVPMKETIKLLMKGSTQKPSESDGARGGWRPLIRSKKQRAQSSHSSILGSPQDKSAYWNTRDSQMEVVTSQGQEDIYEAISEAHEEALKEELKRRRQENNYEYDKIQEPLRNENAAENYPVGEYYYEQNTPANVGFGNSQFKVGHQYRHQNNYQESPQQTPIYNQFSYNSPSHYTYPNQDNYGHNPIGSNMKAALPIENLLYSDPYSGGEHWGGFGDIFSKTKSIFHSVSSKFNGWDSTTKKVLEISIGLLALLAFGGYVGALIFQAALPNNLRYQLFPGVNVTNSGLLGVLVGRSLANANLSNLIQDDRVSRLNLLTRKVGAALRNGKIRFTRKIERIEF